MVLWCVLVFSCTPIGSRHTRFHGTLMAMQTPPANQMQDWLSPATSVYVIHFAGRIASITSGYTTSFTTMKLLLLKRLVISMYYCLFANCAVWGRRGERVEGLGGWWCWVRWLWHGGHSRWRGGGHRDWAETRFVHVACRLFWGPVVLFLCVIHSMHIYKAITCS